MKILPEIASTTHIDLHHECMAKSALDGMAEQIKEKFTPHLIEHDWNRQIGIVLYGEVFQLPDGEYALGIVSGLFENEEEKERYKIGQPNNIWEQYTSYLDIAELLKLVAKNVQPEIISPNPSKSELNIANLLEAYLNSTQVLPNGTVYKIKRFIVATGSLRIVIHPKDHDPAHFHVISKQKNIDARFNLDTLEFLSNKQGNISNNDIKKIQNFFKINPQMFEQLKNEHHRMKQ
jgi:Domain of unknown function (DUF4160)